MFGHPPVSAPTQTEFDCLFEPLLDSDEAAQLLKIHPKNLAARLAREREIPGVQIGKLWRFRRSEMNASMECFVDWQNFFIRTLALAAFRMASDVTLPH